MSKIKEFYKTDGLDYRFRRWEKYPTGQFDYKCTETSIANFLKNKTYTNVLEVGCGPGTWTEIISKHSKNLIAIDISDTMISEAKKSIETGKIEFLNLDIIDFNTNIKFDLIISIRAFEYFPDQASFINKCKSMLNDNGELFIITKTKASYWYGRVKIRKILKSIFPFLFYYENKEIDSIKVKNMNNFQQNRLRTGQFKELLTKNGFSNVTIKPVIIRPPLFMRGKSEIPIIPPFIEKPILMLLKPIDWLLSKSSLFTIFAESYSIFGIKK
jgi:2-polyprenyl-3-methyl-5-hydroxy-6-metoxy-1,4-benzoquinol methylase